MSQILDITQPKETDLIGEARQLEGIIRFILSVIRRGNTYDLSIHVNSDPSKKQSEVPEDTPREIRDLIKRIMDSGFSVEIEESDVYSTTDAHKPFNNYSLPVFDKDLSPLAKEIALASTPILENHKKCDDQAKSFEGRIKYYLLQIPRTVRQGKLMYSVQVIYAPEYPICEYDESDIEEDQTDEPVELLSMTNDIRKLGYLVNVDRMY